MTIRAIKVLVLAAVLGAMWLHIEFASAKVLRWDLRNVTFTDGAAGSGFFLWDADASFDKHLVSWDIAIEGGTSGSGSYPIGPPAPFRFTPSNSGFGGVLADPVRVFTLGGQTFRFGMHCCQLQLTMWFDSVLSDAGGTVGMGAVEWWATSGEPRFATGQVIAIPEASSALFLAIGLVALMFLSALRNSLWLVGGQR